MATTEAQELRRMMKRFRVLIMGRANAGKTTILQKVCNTTDQPEIYDTKGKKIDTTIVESSIKQSRFRIHDSCGFEAGSEEEFENMQNFISERARATKLEERIHAIWYCIPMDEHCRTFQRSEEKFFRECDTGHVPVVVVFTKFEALRPVAFGEIKKQLKGVSGEERSKRIAERVEELLLRQESWISCATPKTVRIPRPMYACRLTLATVLGINKTDANCNTLLEHTTFALDNEELRLCLVSTQNQTWNFASSVPSLSRTLVDRAHKQIDDRGYQHDIAKWFPHLKRYHVYEHVEHVYSSTHAHDPHPSLLLACSQYYREEEYYELSSIQAHDRYPLLLLACSQRNVPHNDNLEKTQRNNIVRVLQPLAVKGSLFTSAANRIIQTGIATIIILEYSAFLPSKGWDGLELVESAVSYYLQSPMVAAVEKVAKEICRQGYHGEELGKKVLEFILDNRLCMSLVVSLEVEVYEQLAAKDLTEKK
ncbi:uncharacterized protein F5891DRAFT_985534 [Suillus fuscotomentosus]|uniref:G domain-containing protein n=1 Tax=Suillus fuscotomentosus TaxID=1912939 RepID=A0AAD4DTZ5_9AGAM|nr:uncharacterized protein F5891DRAFT_985534 [Suillus fuscotomentosus]KAG1893807.1 hypothetical protein F5891DRAFT_985534 [Suillus fuscotomentosus]